MNKKELTELTGLQLFEYYTSQSNEYSNTLFMAQLELGEAIFPMLEKCERESKRVVITEDLQGVLDSPITITIQ